MHRGGHNVGFSLTHRVVIRSGHFRAVYCCCCTIMEPGQRYILHVYLKGRKRDAFNLIAIPAVCGLRCPVPSNGSLMRIIWQLPPRTSYSSRANESLFVHIISKRILMKEIDIKKSYAWLNIFYFLDIFYRFIYFVNFGLKILFILTNEIFINTFELILLFYRSFIISVWLLYWNSIYMNEILHGVWLFGL